MRITFENVVCRRFILVLMAALLAFGMVACGDADNDDANNDANGSHQATGIEVSGTWVSEWAEEEISDTQWGFNPLVKFDNSARVAITKAADDAAFNPGKYGKIVWTPIVDDAFHYCTIEFDLETLKDAENSAKVADVAALDTDGCDGFSWTKLTRK